MDLHSNTVYTLRLIYKLIFDNKSTFKWNGWNGYMFHVWMCVSVKRRKFKQTPPFTEVLLGYADPNCKLPLGK